MFIQNLTKTVAYLTGASAWAVLIFSSTLPGVATARGIDEVSVGSFASEVRQPSRSDAGGLDAFVDAAYAASSAAPFATGTELSGRVTSSMLPTVDHHFRISQRLRPEFDGFYIANEATASLDYLPWEYFHDTGYDPDAPLRALAIVEVSGLLNGRPIDYEAFVFRFVEADGSCWIDLMDPVFPDVNLSADDALLADVFPNCDGPNAVAERAIEAAMPGSAIGGFEAGLEAVANASAGGGTANSMNSSGTGGCTSATWGETYKGGNSSNICSDNAGGGIWVRGGSYSQHVTCAPHGDSCQVQGVGSTDNLHSSIRQKGNFNCDCCDNFGADVTGNNASATLISPQMGITGGHVAIAKSMVAFRTSTGTEMSALTLEGQCGGILDLPNHGASVDYTSKNETQQDKAKIGVWNAENIQVHLCIGSPTDTETKDSKLKLGKLKLH